MRQMSLSQCSKTFPNAENKQIKRETLGSIYSLFRSRPKEHVTGTVSIVPTFCSNVASKSEGNTTELRPQSLLCDSAPVPIHV
jgi:hypothetical protein